jgi:multisubunit Na+/H+ antiporter MnhG subunit
MTDILHGIGAFFVVVGAVFCVIGGIGWCACPTSTRAATAPA